MLMNRSLRWLLAGCAALATPMAAHAELATADATPCVNGVCKVRLTSAQLLKRAEMLIAQHRFTEAAPLLAALENAPDLGMERQFLTGYSAIETGDVDGAIKAFRAALVNHPEQTRIRLELARALMMKGKTASAEHHFRLAGQDKNLPEDILRFVRASRSILRNQRQWTFNVDLGLAPDTNISNGTSATTIDANFGNQIIPLALSSDARKQSGTGETFGVSGSVRLGLHKQTHLLIEGDVQGVNYAGKSYDDYGGQLAIGPVFQLGEEKRLTLQALGSQRYYGGHRAATGLGGRANLQISLDEKQRIGFSLDARHSDSGFSASYSGWQLGAYASYERVIGHAFIASASLFARRDALASADYSDVEFGANLGIGGELPHGINAGISAGVSRAAFDAPLALFSNSARQDWRLNARINVGLRSLRWLGFSPSISYAITRNASSLPLYDSARQRLTFNFAHYF
jgi:hypothetical protein